MDRVGGHQGPSTRLQSTPSSSRHVVVPFPTLEGRGCTSSNNQSNKQKYQQRRTKLQAPLPPDWKPCRSSSGDVYYFNFRSGESRWEHPADEHYKKLYEKHRSSPLAATEFAHSAPSPRNAQRVVPGLQLPTSPDKAQAGDLGDAVEARVKQQIEELVKAQGGRVAAEVASRVSTRVSIQVSDSDKAIKEGVDKEIRAMIAAGVADSEAKIKERIEATLKVPSPSLVLFFSTLHTSPSTRSAVLPMQIPQSASWIRCINHQGSETFTLPWTALQVKIEAGVAQQASRVETEVNQRVHRMIDAGVDQRKDEVLSPEDPSPPGRKTPGGAHGVGWRI